MQIISSYLGSVTVIAQEHGSTLANATVLIGEPSQDNTTARANASGIIRCVHSHRWLWWHAAAVHAYQLQTFAAAVSTILQPGLHELPAQCMQDAGLLQSVPVSPRGASCVIHAHCGGCRQPSDVEVFTWTSTTTGPLAVQLLGAPDWRSPTPLFPRSNLNATVTVMNTQGTTLRTVTGVGVGPFILPDVAAGDYYASVKPSGGGDPVRAAYSSYGSIGQYELVVTYATGVPMNNSTGGQVRHVGA